MTGNPTSLPSKGTILLAAPGLRLLASLRMAVLQNSGLFTSRSFKTNGCATSVQLYTVRDKGRFAFAYLTLTVVVAP